MEEQSEDDSEEKDECSGFKETFECWVQDKTKVASGTQETITKTLLTPNHNFDKDEYVVDINIKCDHNKEFGLLGTFEFKGSCTVRDGSCDTDSTSMEENFCNSLGVILGVITSSEIYVLFDSGNKGLTQSFCDKIFGDK